MNRQETEIFFALLRNALFATPLNCSEWTGEWSWKPIIKAIEDHVLQTLVAEPLVALPASVQPPASVISRYMQYVAMNMQEHVRLNADIDHVFSLLRQNGFNPILLKGQGNATFYPKPFLRKCGDVDMYVGEKDYQPVIDLLLKQLPNAKPHQENDKHLEIFWGKTEIEVHKFAEKLCPPQNDAPYQELVKRWFATPEVVSIGNTEVAVPPFQFLPIYLFNHMWSHFKNGGIGIRQFCDLAMVLHKQSGKFNLQQLKAELKAVDMLFEWKLVGAVVVDYLGLPAGEYPFYEPLGAKKAYNFVSLVLSDGNFAVNRNKNQHSSFFIHFFSSLSIYLKRCLQLSKVSVAFAFRIFFATVHRGLINLRMGRWHLLADR